MSMSSFDQSMLPSFKDINPAQIQDKLIEILDKNREKLATLLAYSGTYTWENLMEPLEDMGDELSKFWSPISHIHSVMETDALRDSYNKALPLLSDYQNEFALNETLFKAIESIQKHSSFPKLTKAQRKIIENDVRDFKLSGVHLPEDKKVRLAALQKKLSQLMTKFSENLLDATNSWMLHIEDVKLLEGLPDQSRELVMHNAKQRKLNGYVFTLDFPCYSTAIKFLQNRELRHKIYEAYATRASDQGPNAGKWDNTKIMEEILETRYEISKMVGFTNYAEYSLATKMAKDPKEVLTFLYDLLNRSRPIAKRELEEIRDIARHLDGITHLEPWDIAYYSEKLQEEKFHFTQEDLRPFFPIQRVLTGMFELVQQLFGIRIEENKKIEVWHPDVRFFEIHDDKNELRGGFYIDLYARPHKRDGAWMDECSGRRLKQDHLQYPVAYLTCNFMRPIGDKPALLTHDDVLTLFHEFGHCLHHMLTKVDYAGVAGINGVAWDAVEFPSQFMEFFCWEKQALDEIAAHYQTGEPLPEGLYKKMLASKHFQTGLQMVRQLEFSLFDFRLHHEYEPSKKNWVQSILNEVRKEAAVVPISEFNRFQHSFSHIFAGGYAAGYYSYKWAEVLSADAYEMFEDHGVFDPGTGRLFLQNILEVGGMRDAKESFVAFRGREPKIDALLRHSGINN